MALPACHHTDQCDISERRSTTLRRQLKQSTIRGGSQTVLLFPLSPLVPLPYQSCIWTRSVNRPHKGRYLDFPQASRRAGYEAYAGAAPAATHRHPGELPGHCPIRLGPHVRCLSSSLVACPLAPNPCGSTRSPEARQSRVGGPCAFASFPDRANHNPQDAGFTTSYNDEVVIRQPAAVPSKIAAEVVPTVVRAQQRAEDRHPGGWG